MVLRQPHPLDAPPGPGDVVRAEQDVEALVSRPVPLVQLDRLDEVIIDIRLLPAVFHHRRHRVGAAHGVHAAYLLPGHVHPSIEPAGHALRDDVLVRPFLQRLQRAGQDFGTRGADEGGIGRQSVEGHALLRTAGQAEALVLYRLTIASHLHAVAQHAVHRQCLRIAEVMRQEGLPVRPLQYVQVLVVRTKTVVVCLRPQPVQAERQAHGSQHDAGHRHRSLPPLAAQVAQGLLQVLHQ